MAVAAKDEVSNALKEKDRKCKSLEGELMQLQEDTAASERARKAAEAERDEMQDLLSGANSAR